MNSRAGVTHQWGRITSWLSSHAPATHARLRPPVPPQALAWYEQRIGTPVHEELRALWALNEGAYVFAFPDFLNGHAPLSIDGSFLCHSLAHVEEGGWQRSWVPFACNDPTDPYSGMFHDAKTGFVGHWAEAEMPAISPGITLADYLKKEADALYEAADQPHGGDVPGTWNGFLVWDDPDRRLHDELAGWRPIHRGNQGATR
ncbi:SMI1/KNR4 family protein [Streptomyces zagrosensis]|uniref:Knr4/Smi1-like domain-containing protein n=1 Tax=Streptomyces zagrosensis TaxID=1042984 RepID=A0A7W9QB75_9ACTN|nr:SMI1/KNR4 family protein [Streptomyces zagrosensis]MBB5935842.1 hypothetical protein [Streptomyces zagrosensis]